MHIKKKNASMFVSEAYMYGDIYLAIIFSFRLKSNSISLIPENVIKSILNNENTKINIYFCYI